jgi:hypothetical protein
MIHPPSPPPGTTTLDEIWRAQDVVTVLLVGVVV